MFEQSDALLEASLEAQEMISPGPRGLFLIPQVDALLEAERAFWLIQDMFL